MTDRKNLPPWTNEKIYGTKSAKKKKSFAAWSTKMIVIIYDEHGKKKKNEAQKESLIKQRLNIDNEPEFSGFFL